MDNSIRGVTSEIYDRVYTHAFMHVHTSAHSLLHGHASHTRAGAQMIPRTGVMLAQHARANILAHAHV
eukprot:6197778-Pleurochrysis_carterae.AAC.1